MKISSIFLDVTIDIQSRSVNCTHLCFNWNLCHCEVTDIVSKPNNFDTTAPILIKFGILSFYADFENQNHFCRRSFVHNTYICLGRRELTFKQRSGRFSTRTKQCLLIFLNLAHTISCTRNICRYPINNRKVILQMKMFLTESFI